MSLERDFIRYEEGPPPRAKDMPHVSIDTKGYIYINRRAHELLARPKAVELYYSPERETIAIAQCGHRMPRSFPVFPHLSGGFYIHAGAFCGHFRIHPKRTQRFIRPDIDNSGYLILDLRQTVNVTSKERKRRKAGE